MQGVTRAKIAVAGLRKEFDSGASRVLALDSIDLAIAAGEFVTIVGPSGCGKSTLLYILGGFVAPSAGRLEAGGRPIVKRGHDFFEHDRVQHRLIALNVDHDIGMESGGSLRDAVGAGTMLRRSHNRVAAELHYGASNAFIVGGNQNVIQVPGQPRALVHVLHHGAAEDIRQGLAFEPR